MIIHVFRRAAASVMAVAVVLLALPAAQRVVAQPTSSAGQTLRQVAVIDLPGPPGRRFDYLTIDDDGRQLFSAHLAAGLLYVVDIRTNTVVATVIDVPGVEGLAYIGEGRKVYTSNWYESKIGVVDLGQMKVVKKIPTEDKPDGIAYVNLLAVVDPTTDTVVGRYPVAGCKGNHGMAIDPERRRAFLSCEGNDVLAVFNLESHQVIARLPMAKGADVVQFDPGLGRIYVACSSGAISVFQMDDPDRFHKVEDVPVPKNVHSLVVDVRTHRIYAPAEQQDGRPAAKMLVFDAVAGASGGASGKMR
jgi:YVTN family beta-propeller protein